VKDGKKKLMPGGLRGAAGHQLKLNKLQK
jgi:hypothetical protein